MRKYFKINFNSLPKNANLKFLSSHEIESRFSGDIVGDTVEIRGHQIPIDWVTEIDNAEADILLDAWIMSEYGS